MQKLSSAPLILLILEATQILVLCIWKTKEIKKKKQLFFYTEYDSQELN